MGAKILQSITQVLQGASFGKGQMSRATIGVCPVTVVCVGSATLGLWAHMVLKRPALAVEGILSACHRLLRCHG